jgi:hypothetical protein
MPVEWARLYCSWMLHELKWCNGVANWRLFYGPSFSYFAWYSYFSHRYIFTSKKFIPTIAIVGRAIEDAGGSCRDVLWEILFRNFPEEIKGNLALSGSRFRFEPVCSEHLIIAIREYRWIFVYETNEDCTFGANLCVTSMHKHEIPNVGWRKLRSYVFVS